MVKKVAKKKSEFLCEYCGNAVEELDFQVLLTTSNKGKIIEDAVFHMDCWRDYWNKAVTKKAKQNVAHIQEKVMGLMENPMLKGILSQVKGSEGLFGMLQIPLEKDVVEKVEEKIDDGRKRAKKPKPKPKKTKA